jgi:hypothetical protein
LGYSAVVLNSGAVAHAFPRNARRAIPTTTANARESSASPTTRTNIVTTKLIKLVMLYFSFANGVGVNACCGIPQQGDPQYKRRHACEQGE